MRSDPAQAAAPAVRPGDAALRPRLARRRARSRRAVVVVGHGAERVTKKLQDDGARPPARVRRAARAARHRRRRRAWASPPSPRRARRRRRRRARAARRHAAAAGRHHRRAGRRTTAPPTPPAPLLTARMSPTPPATAGSCAARTTGSRRIVEQADATDEERAIDEINTSIYCFRAQRARRRRCAASAPRTRRASTTSPTSSRCSPTPATGSSAVVADDAAETQGVNDRLQLAAAEAELRRRTNERLAAPGRHHGRPGAHLRRRHRRARPPTSRSSPARSSRAACVIGAGAEIGPDTRLVDCVVGAGAVVEKTVGRDAEIGDGRPSSARSPCSSPAAASLRGPGPGRSTLLVST